jgi:hypothetical protein
LVGVPAGPRSRLVDRRSSRSGSSLRGAWVSPVAADVGGGFLVVVFVVLTVGWCPPLLSVPLHRLVLPLSCVAHSGFHLLSYP